MCMGRARLVRASGACVAFALAIGGCGSSGTGSSATGHAASSTSGAAGNASSPPGQTPHAPTIGVATGAEGPGQVIEARYTCHGANTSPQLSWKGLPGALAGAKEVIILVRTIARGHGITTNWAVAGISPTVTYIRAGTLPPGAVVGRNSFGQVGYSVCPPPNTPGVGGLITMAVYALPEQLGLTSGFSPEALKGHLERSGVQWGSVLLFGHTPETTSRTTSHTTSG